MTSSPGRALPVTSADVHQDSVIKPLLPRLRERTVKVDLRRRMVEETLDELTELGIFSMLQPKRFGGAEKSAGEFFEAVKDISTACGSTGWVTANFGVHAWHVAQFPELAQHEVWEHDPNAHIAASYAATGVVESAGEDSFRLRGRWRWAAGCSYAQWALLGGLLTNSDGSPRDLAAFLVPMSELRIEDRWHTTGLRGTGSYDLIAGDVLVPAHRMLSFADCSNCMTPGQAINTAGLYRLPLPSLLATAACTPAVGMALGAYMAQVNWIKTHRDETWSGLTWIVGDQNNARLGSAKAEIDGAWLQISSDISAMEFIAQTGEEIPLPLRRQLRRDGVMATARAADAVDHLFEHSSGEVLLLGNPIEQSWRNVHATQVYGLNDLDQTLAMFGASELDLVRYQPMA